MPVDLMKLDTDQLRELMINARRKGADEVYRQAFVRLCTILPGSEDAEGSNDPLVQAFWRAIHAAEHIRTEANGRTTRLSRTRTKVAKDGVVKTISSVVAKPKASEGFHILKDGGLPEFLFESIVLDHPERFGPSVREAAERRLAEEGGA